MKAVRISIITLLVIVALNAIVAGYLFMLDPSGSSLGMSVKLLQHSPFESYMVPGIILFFVNGVLNLVVAAYTLYQRKRWQLLVMLQGGVLFGWIAIQVIMLKQLHYLHFMLAGIAVVLILLSISVNKKVSTLQS